MRKECDHSVIKFVLYRVHPFAGGDKNKSCDRVISFKSESCHLNITYFVYKSIKTI